MLPGSVPNFCRNPALPCQTLQRTVDIACPGDAIQIGGVEGQLNATKIQMKKATKVPPNGSVTAKGDFLLLLPGDVFTAAQGITLELNDSNLSAVSYTFPASECPSTPTKISCRSADKNVKAKFRTSPTAGGLWKFSASFKKQGVPGPFLGPTGIHLKYGPAIDKVDQVSDCVVSFSKIRCREF